MDFDAVITASICHEWDTALYGTKRVVIEKWADILKCNTSTIYRLLETGRMRKTPGYRVENLGHYAKTVSAIKKMPPRERGEISTDQAIRIAIDNGLIPEGMAEISVSSFNRVMRNMEMHKIEARARRYQASRSNELHHVDASSSECFYVAQRLSDGDHLLKLHSSTKGYKNKPLVVERLRPWVYGLVDDFSGYEIARYTVAAGESLTDNLAFLAWAWGKNDEKPFFGLPDMLMADSGPLMKGKISQDWLEKLCVQRLTPPPYEKRAQGKQERQWRTQWQRFEKPFWTDSEVKTSGIPLSELNRRFLLYLEELNSRKHRYEKGMTRLQAWKTINLHGGVMEIPENAIATAARRYERTVGVDGCISLDGETFEVKGFHDGKVWVFRGVFDERRVVVQDQRTGQKYEAVPFKPAPLGTFVGHKQTPHEKAVSLGQTLELHNTLYTTLKDQGNVRQFPTRIKETREIADPFDLDSYRDVEDAMADFMACCGYRLMGEEYETVKSLIIGSRMDRNFVRELAMELQTECERREHHG